MEKSFFSCLPNPSESTVRSVAVWMSDMLEQSKEMVDKKTRKVVEFWWWRPTSGWFRTFGAGGQQPGGGLGPSETISLPSDSYSEKFEILNCACSQVVPTASQISELFLFLL